MIFQNIQKNLVKYLNAYAVFQGEIICNEICILLIKQNNILYRRPA